MLRGRWLIGCVAAVGAIAGGATAIDLGGAPAAATAATSTTPPTLFTGQTLTSGQILSSPDGHYTAEMTPAGALVVSIVNPYGTPRPLWSSGTGNDTGATALLPANGDLSVLDSAGNPVWGVNATAVGCANLDMQTDGDLVLYDSGGAYWENESTQHTMQPGDELLPGQVIFAPGGDYELTMNPAGYLQLVDAAGVIWQSPGSVPDSYARVTAPGNFEIISPTGTYEWTAPVKTAIAGDVLNLGTNGGIAVVDPSGNNEWDPGVGATRTGLTQLNGARPYQTCPATVTTTTTTTTTTTPPPPPTTTTTTTTAPVTVPPSGTSATPTALKSLHVGIELVWRYHHDVSWVTSTRVKRFPRHATLSVTCRGAAGCPTRIKTRHGRRHRVRRSLRSGRSDLHLMLAALRRLRFHAGDRVIFTVSERRHKPERSEVTIRAGRPPLARPLRELRSHLG